MNGSTMCIVSSTCISFPKGFGAASCIPLEAFYRRLGERAHRPVWRSSSSAHGTEKYDFESSLDCRAGLQSKFCYEAARASVLLSNTRRTSSCNDNSRCEDLAFEWVISTEGHPLNMADGVKDGFLPRICGYVYFIQPNSWLFPSSAAHSGQVES